MTVFDLAKLWVDAFETQERPNGEIVVRIKDNAPHDHRLREVVFIVTDRLLPGDIKLEFIAEAIGIIAECGDEAEVLDRLDDIEPDYVTADLLRWLGSSMDRISRVDQAAETSGFTDMISTIQAGQCRERREVVERVYRELVAATEALT